MKGPVLLPPPRANRCANGAVLSSGIVERCARQSLYQICIPSKTHRCFPVPLQDMRGSSDAVVLSVNHRSSSRSAQPHLPPSRALPVRFKAPLFWDPPSSTHKCSNSDNEGNAPPFSNVFPFSAALPPSSTRVVFHTLMYVARNCAHVEIKIDIHPVRSAKLTAVFPSLRTYNVEVTHAIETIVSESFPFFREPGPVAIWEGTVPDRTNIDEQGISNSPNVPYKCPSRSSPNH